MAKKKKKTTAKKATKKMKGPAKKATKKAAKKATTKKATKKAATKKTATQKAAPKATVKKTTQKAAKKATTKIAAAKPSVSDVMAEAMVETEVSLLGQAIPNFEVSSTSGTVSLENLRGKKVVLYFYPKDATPGCTIEGHEFSKLLPEFEQQGAVVYGVSRDDMDSHTKFKDKECFEVELLSDTDETLCRMFDVIKEKNMYGKKSIGIERSTFVIDPDGKVAAEWRKVTAAGHAQEVLNKLKEI